MPTTNRTTKIKPEEAGTPAAYRDEYAEQGRKLCLLLGATDQELARFFDISPETLSEWLVQMPAFATAIRAGKELADADVADRLWAREASEYVPHVLMRQNDGFQTAITLLAPVG